MQQALIYRPSTNNLQLLPVTVKMNMQSDFKPKRFRAKTIAPLLFFIVLSACSHAQSPSTEQFSFSAYGEMYYSYDFSEPPNHEKPAFLYNHKRHNEMNANLLLVKGAYQNEKFRGKLGIMAGNYPQYNLKPEPVWAQFIYEANLGVRLSAKRNLWLDAGIMPSHIGFEGAISADCWTLTRSIVAENSPYYSAGIRLSHTTKNEKLYLSAWLLNGWQRIQRPDGIQRPSFGLQATYRPNERWTFNYSNFLGTALPDSLRSFRHYHNFYLMYQYGNWGITAGLDIGHESIRALNKEGTWFSPVLIVRREINSKTRIALRGEYYGDRNQIVIFTDTPNGFQTSGLSLNIDRDIDERMRFRIEGKAYDSRDAIFREGKNRNYSVTTNLTLRIGAL
jgi:hypothetical protein